MLPTPRRPRASRNRDSERSAEIGRKVTAFPPTFTGLLPTRDPKTTNGDVDVAQQELLTASPSLVAHSPTIQGIPRDQNSRIDDYIAEEKPQLPKNPVEESLTDKTELLRGIGSGAQIWATYVKEANAFDDEQVDGWNRSLDITLVFAALFSAILTAFVLESVRTLQPDPAEITASTLLEISRVLQGMASGQPVMVGRPVLSNLGEFQPTRNAVWVNGLWFFSLSVSVAVSLAAMLAKQWCYYFLSGRTGDDITQAKLRQSRFSGIAKWRMRGILEVLPMLMHLSLAVFSAGLVLFLWDINVAVATTVTAVVVVTMCFYLGTTLLPLAIPFCPFKTLQVEFMREIVASLRRIVLNIQSMVRSKRDPHGVDNKSRLVGLFDRVVAYLFGPTRELQIPRSIESPSTRPCVSTKGQEDGSSRLAVPGGLSEGEDKQHQVFIEDSLSWLIKNSQNSQSIDIAIGALAIGRVNIQPTPSDPDDLVARIRFHLVKHFSNCFKSYKGGVTKLYLIEHRTHASSILDYKNDLASAMDYGRWMTYFAGSSIEGITAQILNLRSEFGVNLVTHLGLAFSSLSECNDQETEDSINIAMWLSTFISLYDSEAMYFNEQVVSVMIDGLTTVTLRIPVSRNIQEYTKILAVPKLIQILWKVSRFDHSPLRSSIGLNLAIFTLKANLHYPFYPRSMDTSATAGRVVANYRSKDISLTGQELVPLVLFSMLGFLHPGNSHIGLDGNTKHTISKLIHEPRFFAGRLGDASLSSISQIVNPDSFQQHMAMMLIETMVSKSLPDGMSPEQVRSTLSCLQLASMRGVYPRTPVFYTESVLRATCQLIYDHFHKNIELYPEILVAAAGLFLRETKKLKRLESKILYSSANSATPVLSRLDFGWPQDVPPTLDSQEVTPIAKEPATLEFIAMAILMLMMLESEDKGCIETAVRAALHHSSDCRVDVVVHAIAWFADSQVQQITRGKLLSVSGYARVLVALITRCPDPQGLVGSLKHRTSSGTDRALWRSILKTVGDILTRFAHEKEDNHIYAFGIAGLAVWNLRIVLPVVGAGGYLSHVNSDQLSSVWSLLRGHLLDQLRSEALEALVDTTVLLAAFEKQTSKITPEHIHLILGLLERFHSESEPHVRPALAVALTFWGLSFEDHDWEFWTYEERQRYWVEYSQLGRRNTDTAPLLLLGLSRILAHYSLLELDHSSIIIITHEIERYMNMHADGQTNLTLYFLPQKFDVRRHVRESVWAYLQETQEYGPFTRSTNEIRKQLSSAIMSNGGEGYKYEKPQPFRKAAKLLTEDSVRVPGFCPSNGPAQDSVVGDTPPAIEMSE